MFSESYPQLISATAAVREDKAGISEHVLQRAWQDQDFEGQLRTLEGHALEVISPGWWNRIEGPDFRGAQIKFNGKLYTGDVEVHFTAGAWRAHGHDGDPRYSDVILHVILEPAAAAPARTAVGRSIPTLAIGPYLRESLDDIASRVETETATVAHRFGNCSALIPEQGTEPVSKLISLAADWRMLNKAHAMLQRMERVGVDQALYEALMYACGFSHFKQQFQSIARHLPSDRARQLAQQDPLLLEAALLQLAGLLPREWPGAMAPLPHFVKLHALRKEHLEGLRSLPLEWRRNGIRPNNYPERRLAGMAMFVARTSANGIVATLDSIWRADIAALQQRRQFEKLFPRAMGFWASHCTWTGKQLSSPSAPIGAGRVRSILGNVFIPAALSLARKNKDRTREEKVFSFFAALPKEPENHIVKTMAPRLMGAEGEIKLSFRVQQGLLQMYQDWCDPNPSCSNCRVFDYLDQRGDA